MEKILLGIDAIQPVGDQAAGSTMQFRGKLDPGGAGADDRDMQLPGCQRHLLHLGP